MSATLLQRHLGLPCRLFYTRASWASTSSAINRGLRATQDDGSSRTAGRDVSRGGSSNRASTQRPTFKDRRKLSEHVDLERKPMRYGRERGSSRYNGRRDTLEAFSRTGGGTGRFNDRRDGRDSPRTGTPGFVRQRGDGSGSASRVGRFDDALRSSPGRRRPERLATRSADRPAKPPGERMQRTSGRESPPGGTSRSRSYDTGKELSRSRMSRPGRFNDCHEQADALYSHEENLVKPHQGLLKSIRKALQAVVKMQQLEAEGKDPSELAQEARHALKIVNSSISTGNFRKGDEPAEAVVSMFKSKAKDGTFLAGNLPDGKTSVIYVTKDGVIDLAIGEPRATGRAASQYERYDPRQDRRGNLETAPTAPASRARPAREVEDEDDSIPISVPYTTPSSDFLYGYNSVLAALLGKRRTVYKLYVHPKIFEREVGGQGTYSGQKPASELVELAKEAGIPFRNEFKTAMLDKMSEGRPHNGVILEASKLPSPPVLSLLKPEVKKGVIPITLGEQSKEEAKINGSPRTISALRGGWRHPFVVLLDGITDPGNVGNIIRTCHFYGVDAVAIATNTCASLSSGILAKASAGACEAMQILSLPKPSSFVHDSSRYRWKVYAAVAPTGKKDVSGRHTTVSNLASESPLAKHPCILMLGAEGAGLRENLRSRADLFVSIEAGSRHELMPDVGVDSMNVNAAAGVLLDAFLKKPADAPLTVASEELGF